MSGDVEVFGLRVTNMNSFSLFCLCLLSTTSSLCLAMMDRSLWSCGPRRRVSAMNGWRPSNRRGTNEWLYKGHLCSSLHGHKWCDRTSRWESIKMNINGHTDLNVIALWIQIIAFQRLSTFHYPLVSANYSNIGKFDLYTIYHIFLGENYVIVALSHCFLKALAAKVWSLSWFL